MTDAITMARFRKFCGLLGSEHDGERAAAALKATELLRTQGKTWADVGIGSATTVAEGYANAALVDVFQKMLDAERARTTHMAEEINRLTREVNRLKGMWPNGEPRSAA